MKSMSASDTAWQSLKQTIIAGEPSELAWLVSGPPIQVAADTETLLASNSHIIYFLCCGGTALHVPCYRRFTPLASVQKQGAHRLGTFLIDKANNDDERQHYNMDALLALIPAQEIREQHRFLFLIECLAPPSEKEKRFFKLITATALQTGISIGFLMHEEVENANEIIQQASQYPDELAMLYLCGGALRSQEWLNMTSVIASGSSLEPVFSMRHVASEQWLCYANNAIACMAEATFQSMQQAQRQNLANHVLAALSGTAWHPYLDIALQTNDWQSVYQLYTRATIARALDEPEVLPRYFTHLQHLAHATGYIKLAYEANINAIISLLYLKTIDALAVYQRITEACIEHVEHEIAAHFWFTLGQQLARIRDDQAWEYAQLCFERCRNATLCIQQVSTQQLALRLAAIENGEALLAYKRKQVEKAHSLEQAALERTTETLIHPLKYHLLINMGQIYQKLYAKTDAARAQYEAAFTYCLNSPAQSLPSKTIAIFVNGATLKLTELFFSEGRYDDAIHFLQEALDYLANAPDRFQTTFIFKLFDLNIQLTRAFLLVQDVEHARAQVKYTLDLLPAWFPGEKVQRAFQQLEQSGCILHPALRTYIRQEMVKREEAFNGLIHAQTLVQNVLDDYYQSHKILLPIP